VQPAGGAAALRARRPILDLTPPPCEWSGSRRLSKLLRGSPAPRGHWRIEWASGADPADAGPGMALFPAGVTARDCTAPKALGTPWIADWRLRRCRLDFAKERRSCEKERKDWQAHRSLLERSVCPNPHVDPIELRHDVGGNPDPTDRRRCTAPRGHQWRSFRVMSAPGEKFRSAHM
jgi:hypothetical protein